MLASAEALAAEGRVIVRPGVPRAGDSPARSPSGTGRLRSRRGPGSEACAPGQGPRAAPCAPAPPAPSAFPRREGSAAASGPERGSPHTPRAVPGRRPRVRLLSPGPGAQPPVRLEVLERLLPRTPPPPAMESELLQSPLLGLGEEDEADLTDWNLPLAFMKKRHCEKIEGSKSLAQSWRMKDRVGGRGPRPGPGEAGGVLSWPPPASQLQTTHTVSGSSFWPKMHGPFWLVSHRPGVKSN